MQDENRLQIAGVVEDARHGSLRDAPRPAIFRFYQGGGAINARFAVRARTPAGAEFLKSRIQGLARQFGFSATDVYTMREVTEFTLAREWFLAQLVGGLGLLAIMFTAGGIYGLVAHSMRRRRPEFAIRLAVGAEFRHLTAMAVGESTLPVLVGCLLGLVSSHAALRTVSSLLYGLEPADPWTSAFATMLVVIVAVFAAYVPVSRAARTDPLTTLRAQ
jgi:ABC-type antimicrobial peptide transport system permease subunit